MPAPCRSPSRRPQRRSCHLHCSRLAAYAIAGRGRRGQGSQVAARLRPCLPHGRFHELFHRPVIGIVAAGVDAGAALARAAGRLGQRRGQKEALLGPPDVDPVAPRNLLRPMAGRAAAWRGSPRSAGQLAIGRQVVGLRLEPLVDEAVVIRARWRRSRSPAAATRRCSSSARLLHGPSAQHLDQPALVRAEGQRHGDPGVVVDVGAGDEVPAE